MRIAWLIPALVAALICFGPQLTAQYNSPRAFSFSMDPASGSRLGVGLRDIDSDRANVIKLGDPRGVEVMSVEEDSPADHAGIKAGDVLLSYNGEAVMGAQQLGRLVSETPRGRRVKIEYWREGKVATLTATTAAPQATAFPAMPDLDIQDVHGWAQSIPTPTLIWRTPLGIECESIDSQLAEFFGVKRGVLIRSVSKDSPAEEAGLRAGDVVTRIGDRPVTEPKDIVSYVRLESRSPKPFAIEVIREHKPVNVKIAPAQK
jgi:serine protease Do